jgi:hypothetical protein
MTFINPILAAAGLAAVSIPIIIHFLMRRRRKPVMWGAMRFLLEAYRQHRRRLKLEQFLLLAARCLLVALVALALGRPLIGAAMGLSGSGPVTVYLLIDNGLAASASEPGVPEASALQRHKKAAAALLGQLDAAAGDRVALLTLGGPAQGTVMPPSSDIAAVRDLVAGLATVDSAADLPGAIAMVKDDLGGTASRARVGRTVIVVLSDFLAGSADTQRKLVDLGRNPGLALMASIPPAAAPANVSLVAMEPDNPVVLSSGPGARSTQVRLGLRRSGAGLAQAGVSTVRLSIQADPRQPPAPAGQAVIRWGPGQSEATATAAADFSALGSSEGAGVLLGALDADAIAADDLYRRPVEVRSTLHVGIVAPRALGGRAGLQLYQPEDWLRLALLPAEGAGRGGDLELVDIEPAVLDATRLAGLDAALIPHPDSLPEGAWGRLRAFADSGGLIVITPAPTQTVHLWADGMSRELGLPWEVSREARGFDQGIGLAAQPEPGATLLAQVRAELPELVKPVRIFRALSLQSLPGAVDRGAVLLRLEDGSPLAVAVRPGVREATPGEPPRAPEPSRGLVVLIAAAPSFDWTDLQVKPLMVPLIQEIVRQGVGRARGSWSAIAGAAVEVPPRTAELRPLDGGAALRIAGAHTAEPVRRAGLWRAADDRGISRALVAVNADPAGGRADAQPQAALAAWLSAAIGGAPVQWLESLERPGSAQAGGLHAVASRGDGMRYVLPLLVAALVVALLELALARFFSHASLAIPARGGAA